MSNTQVSANIYIYILFDYLHTTACYKNLPNFFLQQFRGGRRKYIIYCWGDTAYPYANGTPVHT